MRENEIVGRRRRRYCRTTDSNHEEPIAPNLVSRDFTAKTTNRLWVSDITYLPTADGWLFLAAILDVYSRRIVGWSMGESLETKLVEEAFAMAAARRQPERGLVYHSDRGSQYASDAHRKVLQGHGCVQSMSRRGDCWDNAMMESFFGTLKAELDVKLERVSRKAAKTIVFDYIEGFYNNKRRHSALDYMSPAEYERRRAV